MCENMLDTSRVFFTAQGTNMQARSKKKMCVWLTTVSPSLLVVRSESPHTVSVCVDTVYAWKRRGVGASLMC